MSTKSTNHFISKLVTLFLAVCLTASTMVLPSLAAEGRDFPIETKSSSIQPYWLNARTVSFSLSFAEPTIYISAIVSGNMGTTYKNGTVTLEKISGTNRGVKGHWTNLSSSSAVFTFSNQSVQRERGTYRLTLTITTVSNSGTEVITQYKDGTY